ncbi:hypothetical protein B0H13DRAFT_2232502 [Mycena leptocephala]|nr:hypothetical protein B0H13DRAFT_2232502 [Mycena leptocephala]
MIPTLGHFILVLQLYFIPEFSLKRALYILTVLVATYPLFRLHMNQRREPRQPRETAWLRSIVQILAGAFNPEHEHPHFPPEEDDVGIGLSHTLCQDLEQLYHFLGIDDGVTTLFPELHTILCTTRINCILCLNDGHPPTLRRHREPRKIRLLDSRFRWVEGALYVAYCARCHAEYYPDRITYHADENSPGRIQKLEYGATYLRVSKHGIWMDRRIAVAQENAILRFHSGWSSFAEWLNDTISVSPRVTTRESQRLYFEHFARRLISAHDLEDTFSVPAHSSANALVEAVRTAVGEDGGVVAGAMKHGCTRCTHLKRYTADLLAEGAVLDENESGVVDAPPAQGNAVDHNVPAGAIPPELTPHPKQQERVQGSPRGYTRLAVMDGKTISHRICAISICERPLVNYKNGRFCQDHLGMRFICGIIPCRRPVHSDGAVTCDNESHKEWHQKHPATMSTYCLQTVRWSCGCPIGWGKCYRSESSSQESHPQSRPSFLAYDDACNLLRHIVTQNPNSLWIQSTKLIVDAWHYIGHQAADILCRVWCNPAPTNGSQPDLISVSIDGNGRTHTTRAFNTETAEQLNAWLNGYEAQLRQMSNINYDFSVHVLMLLYKELVDKRVEKKEEGLNDEFWEIVDSTN